MRKFFGTDGIRGVANSELTPELAYKVGRAAAFKLKEDGRSEIVIGRDTRISGDLIQSAITAGVLSTGVDVVDVGIIPTPAIAYLTKYFNAIAGIVISASHNPGEFNGIKFFSSSGFKLPDETEREIEELIENPELVKASPVGAEVGRLKHDYKATREYIDYIKSRFDMSLNGLKLVIDCGHGATATVVEELFKELGADSIVLNTDFDGMDINDNCGSTNPELTQKAVLEHNADLGISFDGDGDRLIAVDEKGRIMDGDHYLAAVGTHLLNKGKLPNNTIVGTVMRNIGLCEYAEKIGLNIIATAVGDRYVLEKMIEGGYTLGGEQSGHFIFLDDNTTGDGILAALKLIETMLEAEKPLSELNDYMVTYPQVLKNAEVSNEAKNNYESDEVIANAIREFEEKFKNNGRVLIRPSGTEPLIRVMVEGKDIEVLEEESEKLVKLLEERLN